MTSAAIQTYARGLAIELASKKIAATAFYPGMVEASLIHGGSALDAGDYKEDMKKYPVKYGQPEDVAHLAVHLLSDAASWMTPSNHGIDGGRCQR